MSDGENAVQWQAAREVSVGLLEMFVGYCCIVVPKGNFGSGANNLRDSTEIIFAGVCHSRATKSWSLCKLVLERA